MNNPNAAKNLTAPTFKPGQSGNPGGKTSAQRQAEIANAEAATRLRTRMLTGLERELEKADAKREQAFADGDMEAAERADAAVEMISANILKLLKDSEDRGLGTPVQSVNVESPQGTMTPQVITRRVVDPQDGTDD